MQNPSQKALGVVIKTTRSYMLAIPVMENLRAMQIIIRKVCSKYDLPFDLLLLADESIGVIEKYIYDSEVYVATESEDSEAVAVFALLKLNNSDIEIKNIAVAETLQNRGIGSFLISEIKRLAKVAKFENVIVGTPDRAVKQINFYENNGFIKYDLKKDFFIKNYPEPIIDNGVMLRDMVMLKVKVSSRPQLAISILA
jgi:ribosomal protein S18 acetylase RimI-like enzyme